MIFDDEPTQETPPPEEGEQDLNLENLDDQGDTNDDPSPEDETEEIDGGRFGAVYDVPVQVSAVLGKSEMQVNQLLKLGRGAIVELDRKVGEAIDVYVNDRLVARGEIVVVNDRLGVTMTEIIKSDRANS